MLSSDRNQEGNTASEDPLVSELFQGLRQRPEVGEATAWRWVRWVITPATAVLVLVGYLIMVALVSRGHPREEEFSLILSLFVTGGLVFGGARAAGLPVRRLAWSIIGRMALGGILLFVVWFVVITLSMPSCPDVVGPETTTC